MQKTTTNPLVPIIILSIPVLLFIFYLRSQSNTFQPEPPQKNYPSQVTKESPYLQPQNSPANQPLTSPKPKKSVVTDQLLNITYYCDSEYVDDIEKSLQKLSDKNDQDSAQLDNSNTSCLERCDRYADEMKECSTRSCLDTLKEDGERCVSQCSDQMSELNKQLNSSTKAFGETVYKLVEAHCTTSN